MKLKTLNFINIDKKWKVYVLEKVFLFLYTLKFYDNFTEPDKIFYFDLYTQSERELNRVFLFLQRRDLNM